MRRLNPKSELLNTKQIQMPKIQNSKHLIFDLPPFQKGRGLYRVCFEHLKLGFRYCSPCEINEKSISRGKGFRPELDSGLRLGF
jgi:hypothetical protein